jgi:hypothetical protein
MTYGVIPQLRAPLQKRDRVGEFEKRKRSRFSDPVFRPLNRELGAIVEAAWDAYINSRKSPVTRKAGPGFADPEYEISVDWLAAREAIHAAQRRHDDASETPRILIINGSSRSASGPIIFVVVAEGFGTRLSGFTIAKDSALSELIDTNQRCYGIKTSAPVVLRLSRSECAAPASASG